MASNDWFGKIKSRARAVQETAKTRLEKLSDTLDKKVKEAQEDLDKQRLAESPAPAAPTIRRWRPSADNPDGEIVAEKKPPPPIEQLVVQPAPSSPLSPPPPPSSASSLSSPPPLPPSSASSLSSPPPPPSSASSLSSPPPPSETSETSAPTEELMTVTRKHKGKPRSTKSKNSSIKQSDDHEKVVLDVDNTDQRIIDQETVNKHSNELNDKISTVDKLVENNTTFAIPQKEDLILTQNSTDYSKNDINIQKEESVSVNAELNQEIISTNISTDPLLTSKNIDNSRINHSDLENISVHRKSDEQPTLTNIDDSSISNSNSENIPISDVTDQLLASTNIDNPSVEHSDQESIQKTIPDEESTILCNNDKSVIEHSGPENVPDNLTISTNIDDSSKADPNPDISHDKIPISMNIVDVLVENSNLANIQMEIRDDKLPTLIDTVDLPVVDSDSENVPMNIPTNELSASTKNDESPVEHSDPENIEIQISDNEPITLANIDDSPKARADSETIPQDISNDELLASTKNEETFGEGTEPDNIQTEVLDDKLATLTDTNDLPKARADSEATPQDISDDEWLASTKNDEIVGEHSEPENTQTEVLDDKLPTLTDTNDLSVAKSNPENIPEDISDDEWLASTKNDETVGEHSEPENTQTEVLDDKLPTLTDTTDSPKARADSEATPQDISDDEWLASTKNDETLGEHTEPENTQTEVLDDKLPRLTDTTDLPVAKSNPENILQDLSDDEWLASTKNDETLGGDTESENAQTEVLDDKLSTLTVTTDLPVGKSNPENIFQDLSDDEWLASTKNDETLGEGTELENAQTEVLDDKLPRLTDTADLLVVKSNLENTPKDVSDDELSASMKSDDTSTEHSDSDNKLSTAANIDDSLQIHTDLEKVSQDITEDQRPTTGDIIDSFNVNSAPKNILMTIPDDALPVVTEIDNPLNAEPGQDNILMHIPDYELPEIEHIVDLPIVNASRENILMSIPDDELPEIEHIVHLPIVNSSTENILMNIPDDELPILTSADNSSVIDSNPKSSQMKTADAKLPILTNVNKVPIANSAPENSSLTKSNADKVLPLTTINNTPIKQTKLKNELPTPTSELEDSFEELKTTNIPVHRAPEKPLQQSTKLSELRAFISKIEDKDDQDEEPIPLKRPTSILEKKIDTKPEQPNTPNILKTNLSSPSTSISDDSPEDLFNEAPAPNDSFNDEPSIDSTNEIISTMSIERTSVENKRIPTVNNHPIPPGTKIEHINCSSTYIYFCATNRKIFYAKLNPNNLDDPFKWEQHTDLAEQLVVSVTNQTVWRLHNKTLYSANDPIKFPPLGSHWNKINIDNSQHLLSMSINDQCGWYTKEDGTLWFLRTDDKTYESINVSCPYTLNRVFCFSEKVGVSTIDGQILIRAGCTPDAPEGGGWIFIEHNFGPIDDFVLLTNSNMITIVDKKHHLWMQQVSSDKGFYEILCDDDLYMSNRRYLLSVNSQLLCFTDCEKQIHVFSDCLTGLQWTTIEKNTRLQRLIGAFSNEDFVWAITTDRHISSSNGKVFVKPRQAQYLTHATFVPNNSSQNTVLWSLDESCGIYVRPNLEINTEWEQVNQIQFEWSRRLINIVCNHAGVWAVDDKGFVHFRHGHISASQNVSSYGPTILPPAWILVPGEAKKHRNFSQVFCGPVDWMVYATDNKQNVYTRVGINEENRIGTSWKAIEDCSALELAISQHTLWLLTSFGEIQCRENISLLNPIGTRSTTLSGLFLSLTVSMDDSQVWALDSKRNLLKLDRSTVLFEK